MATGKRRVEVEFVATDKATPVIDKVGKSAENLNKNATKAVAPLANIGKTMAIVAATGAGVAAAAYAIDRLLEAGQQATNVARGFDTLTQRIGGMAETALPKLRKATLGLVSDMELMEQANNAVKLGIPLTEDSLARLASQAVTLGRAMGVDAKRAVDTLVVGIGRQSEQLLQNLGLTVDAKKAYDDYAAALGTTADKLSVADKKQAFLNATLNEANQATRSLKPEVYTLAEALGQLKTKMENMRVSILRFLNEAGGRFLEWLDRISAGPWGIKLPTREVEQFADTWKLPMLAVERYNTKIQTLPPSFQAINQEVKVLETRFLTLDEVANLFVEHGGRKTVQLMDLLKWKFQGLEKEFRQAFRGIALSLPARMGDALVDAADRGREAFREFFKQLLADIARTIAQILIMRALLNLFPGLSAGFPLPIKKSAVATGAEAIPSPIRKSAIADDVVEAALGRGSGRQIEIRLLSDIPMLVDRVNAGVAAGSVRVVATEFAGGRSVR